MEFNGSLIKEKRKELKLTQDDLAKLVNCSQPIICQIEKNCYNHEIDESIVEEICVALDLSIRDVIIENEDNDIMNVDIIEEVFETSTSIDSLDKYKPYLDSDEKVIRFNILNGIKKWKLSYIEESTKDLDTAYEKFLESNQEVNLDIMFLLTILSIGYCRLSLFNKSFITMMDIIVYYYEQDFKDKNFKYCMLLWSQMMGFCIVKNNMAIYKQLFRIKYVELYYYSYKNYNGMPSFR